LIRDVILGDQCEAAGFLDSVAYCGGQRRQDESRHDENVIRVCFLRILLRFVAGVRAAASSSKEKHSAATATSRSALSSAS
jgi:hypothetical protein